MAFLCVRCSTDEDSIEFDTIKELKEHEMGGHKSRPKKELPPSKPVEPSATEKLEEKKPEKVEPVIEIKPLVLTYKCLQSCPAISFGVTNCTSGTFLIKNRL